MLGQESVAWLAGDASPEDAAAECLAAPPPGEEGAAAPDAAFAVDGVDGVDGGPVGGPAGVTADWPVGAIAQAARAGSLPATATSPLLPGGGPPPPTEAWPAMALLELGSDKLPAVCEFPPPGAGAFAALQASAAHVLGVREPPRLFASLAVSGAHRRVQLLDEKGPALVSAPLLFEISGANWRVQPLDDRELELAALT